MRALFNKRHSWRAQAFIATLCGVSATAILPANSLANGRFPFAQSVIVGPAGPTQEIVLRATFGLVWSHDGGRTFDWVCEQSIGFEGNWDPPTVFATSSLLVGLPDGLTSSNAGCTFARNTTVGRTQIIDLAATMDGQRVFAIEGVPVAQNRIFFSTNGGADFTVGARTPMNVILDTIEFAPSNPQRVYVTGSDPGTRTARLFRSDDGGRSVTMLPPLPLGTNAAFVSGVAFNQPDDLWLRVQNDRGSDLLRSTDGGMTFRRAYPGVGELLGFALSSDGRVWVGGSDDGLQFSQTGETFSQISPVKVSCLRHRDGVLYLCADWINEPFALARWRDGAPALEPMLQFDQIRGPANCDPASSTSVECAPRWPVLQQTLRRRPAGDSGVTLDASTDIGPAVTMDAQATLDSSVMLDGATDDRGVTTRPSCTCTVVNHRKGMYHQNYIAFIALSIAAVASRKTSRRSQNC